MYCAVRRHRRTWRSSDLVRATSGRIESEKGIWKRDVTCIGGDTEGAINDLEQAVKLLPENVAARSLLAMAYADYGMSERSGSRRVSGS